MADKRISQLVDRGTVANNDVVPIVVSGAVTTNKATISSIQTFMQGNLDLGVTSVGITFGTSGTDINASGSPVTSSGNITINLPTASATNRGALSSADWITFNAKQPAGNYVTLDTTQTITAQKTFTTSGSSDTMIISHGSGAGFALDVIKAGNNEAIRVTKTSGSGNAMTISGGNFEAGTIVKTGGTSSQFLKADGSVDSTAYTTNTGTVTSVGLSSATSGVTIGSTPITTSGTITLAIATASGSQNGLLSSTDWTTFNGKQNALTNPITGTGATGQVAYWTGTNSQTGSNNLFWDNANVKLGIGTNTPEGTGLTVAGGGVLVSLDSGADRKVLELYATSTGAKVSSSYVGASSYGNLELLTSGLARLTIASTGAATFSGALNGTSASFSGNININGTNAVPISLLNIYNDVAKLNVVLGSAGAGGTVGVLALFNSVGTETVTILGTGAATFSSTVETTGIKFPATQVASADANTLDDYEEGTWTPTVIGGGTAGTYTLDTIYAYYTKIGNQVTIWAYFDFSAASGGTSYIRIGGAPFSYKANSRIAGAIFTSNLNTTASSSNGMSIANDSSSVNTTFLPILNIDNDASENIPISGVSTSTSFQFNLSYTVS